MKKISQRLSYDPARQAPFVAPKGLIVFDDAPNWPGPTRLVSELPRWYVQVAISPNQWIVQKI
jgi:hypothetical protein